MDAMRIRPAFDTMPAPLRSAVDELLGSPVVDAVSQPGGFSPGPADRVCCADGRRAFVKGVNVHTNEVSTAMHRSEARVLGHLPTSAPVPRLIGVVDDHDWVVLVSEQVEGHHPELPWRASDLDAMRVALRRLEVAGSPCPVPDLERNEVAFAEWGELWRDLLDGAPADLDPWVTARVPALVALAEEVLPRTGGESLCHGDLRSDNVLVTEAGEAVLIDWPSATRGAVWTDGALMAIEVARTGTVAETDGFLSALADDFGVDARLVAGLTATTLSYFVNRSRLPEPPELRGIRDFQRAQELGLVRWLQGTGLVAVDA